MINLLVSVVIVCLIIGLFLWALSALPFIPAPMAQIIKVFVIVVGCLWLISTLFGHSGFGIWGGLGHHININ